MQIDWVHFSPFYYAHIITLGQLNKIITFFINYNYSHKIKHLFENFTIKYIYFFIFVLGIISIFFTHNFLRILKILLSKSQCSIK